MIKRAFNADIGKIALSCSTYRFTGCQAREKVSAFDAGFIARTINIVIQSRRAGCTIIIECTR